jgi:hypothetical protein
MSFATQGFLFDGSFRTAVKKVPDFNLWFAYAGDLNRLGLDMLRDLTVASDDIQRVTIAALFVRAHHSFQAGPRPRRNGTSSRRPRRSAECGGGDYRDNCPRQ